MQELIHLLTVCLKHRIGFICLDWNIKIYLKTQLSLGL